MGTTTATFLQSSLFFTIFIHLVLGSAIASSLVSIFYTKTLDLYMTKIVRPIVTLHGTSAQIVATMLLLVVGFLMFFVFSSTGIMAIVSDLIGFGLGLLASIYRGKNQLSVSAPVEG